jgi:hypothetical protein
MNDFLSQRMDQQDEDVRKKQMQLYMYCSALTFNEDKIPVV